jgi:hypothetical protein
MTHWILVLILGWTTGSGQNASISSIPGFYTEAACKSAGEQLLMDLPDVSWRDHGYECIKDGGPL